MNETWTIKKSFFFIIKLLFNPEKTIFAFLWKPKITQTTTINITHKKKLHKSASSYISVVFTIVCLKKYFYLHPFIWTLISECGLSHKESQLCSTTIFCCVDQDHQLIKLTTKNKPSKNSLEKCFEQSIFFIELIEN